MVLFNDSTGYQAPQLLCEVSVIPSNTSDAIATANGSSGHPHYRQLEKFSANDQKDVDKSCEHWLSDRRQGDRDAAAKDRGKMQELMARYNIPRDVPYNVLASGARVCSR
jgi:hypothetical protein